MKISELPGVLFDEFPTNKSIRLCFFTQPKIPLKDYSDYAGRTSFYCTEATFKTMADFKNTPKRLYKIIDVHVKLQFDTKTTFKIAAVPTGNLSGSVMLLIFIGDKIHLYTGQFKECKRVLRSHVIQHYKDRIDDIYVDNTMAALVTAWPLDKTRDQISQIVKDHRHYNIYLDMELFGYEDILVEMARNSIKVQLVDAQRALFNASKKSNLFNYHGEPHVKVNARISKVPAYTIEAYRMLYEKSKIVHIKLIPVQHENYSSHNIAGLFLVPYTPHADSQILRDLFRTIKPKCVHPLIPQAFECDPISVIPGDVLNDGCKIVEHEFDEFVKSNEGNNGIKINAHVARGHHYLETEPLNTQERKQGPDIIYDDSDSDENQTAGTVDVDNNSDKNIGQTQTSNSHQNKASEIEIIDLDDDDEDDDILELDISHSRSTSDTSDIRIISDDDEEIQAPESIIKVIESSASNQIERNSTDINDNNNKNKNNNNDLTDKDDGTHVSFHQNDVPGIIETRAPTTGAKRNDDQHADQMANQCEETQEEPNDERIDSHDTDQNADENDLEIFWRNLYGNEDSVSSDSSQSSYPDYPDY